MSARCFNCWAGIAEDTPNVWKPSGPLAKARGWVFCPECASAMAEVRRDGFETVSWPGKFEGEPAWVPLFYQRMLDGWCASSEKWRYGAIASETFKVDAADRAMFPELRGRRSVRLHYDDSGFVRGE